ncbi:MAG TPA: hypothetical protein VEG44_01735 [Candidatus Acidoferrales bacterium]|nr:hypothetical protein [Candidatus Acidoferrales bacterium]
MSSHYPHNDIIDAEKLALELEIDSLNRRIEDLEVKLRGALFMIEMDYRGMKGLQRDIDDMYMRVF